MAKLKCLSLPLVLSLAFSLGAQTLTGELGNPAAKTFVISAQILDEGSFELQRAGPGFTNWASITSFNSFPGTNTFSDARTNNHRFYRLVRLNAPAVLTSQPVGVTNFYDQEVRLEASATGSWPMRFQWFKGEQPIEGATSNKLVFPGRVELSGNYTLLVSNLWGLDLTEPVAVKTLNTVALSIAGKTIRYVIKGREGPFIGVGNFETTYNASGFYNTDGSSVLLNDAGNWQYAALSGNIGRAFLTASFVYPNNAFIDMTFTNTTSGTYRLQVPNQGGNQFGEFTFVE